MSLLGRVLQRGGVGPVALLLAWAWLPPATAQNRANPEVAACVAANRAGYIEIAQAQEGGVRRHALQAVVVARLQVLGSRLGKLKEITNKPPRNLADCEQATQALTAAREQLERIVGSPQQVAECTAANQQAHTEMQAALLSLQQAGSNAPAASVQQAAARLDVLRAAAGRDGPTLAECRQLASEFADERTQLQRLLPPGTPQRTVAAGAAGAVGAAGVAGAVGGAATAVAATTPTALASPEAAASAAAQCREAQARSYNEVAQSYARLVSAGPIAAEWMAPLQSLSERLTRLHAVIANPAAPGWDCDAVTKALAQARGELAALVRR